MRLSAAVFAALLTGVGAAHAFETNQSRPGGVYMQSPAATPQACARACENDSLCMAWTHQPQQSQSCELKAVIPPARYLEGATSGLSSRAPRLLRLIPPAEPPAPPADISSPVSATDAQSNAPATSSGQTAPLMTEATGMASMASLAPNDMMPNAHATTADLVAVGSPRDSSNALVKADLSGDQPVMSVRLGERIGSGLQPAPLLEPQDGGSSNAARASRSPKATPPLRTGR